MDQKQKSKIFLVASSLIPLLLFFSSCAASSSTKKKGGASNVSTDQVLRNPATSGEAKQYKQLLEDSHMEIRLAAAKVLLDYYRDTTGYSVLLEALRGEDKHFRIDSFLELAEKPTQEILPDLEKAVKNEKDAMARFVMKRALKDAKNKLK